MFGLSTELNAVASPKNVTTGPEPGGNVGVAVRVIVAVGVMVRVGVSVRVGVAVRVPVAVRVALGVGVRVGVRVEVRVGVGVPVSVAVRVRLGVLVAVARRVLNGVRVTVGLGVCVPVGREVAVRVAVRVTDAVTVRVAVSVLVGVRVGVPNTGKDVVVGVPVSDGVAVGVGVVALRRAITIAVASATLMRPSSLASAVSHVLGPPRTIAITASTSASSSRPSQLASNRTNAPLPASDLREAGESAATLAAANRRATITPHVVVVSVYSISPCFRLRSRQSSHSNDDLLGWPDGTVSIA